MFNRSRFFLSPRLNSSNNLITYLQIHELNSFIVVSSQLLVQFFFFTDFSPESLLLIFFCSYCYDMEWLFFLT